MQIAFVFVLTIHCVRMPCAPVQIEVCECVNLAAGNRWYMTRVCVYNRKEREHVCAVNTWAVVMNERFG